jgi:hypothetical protein
VPLRHTSYFTEHCSWNSDPWLYPALRYLSIIRKCFVGNSEDISAKIISSIDQSLVYEVVTEIDVIVKDETPLTSPFYRPFLLVARPD